jgi:DNA polymerase III epsilon subunit-like protein
MDVLLWFVFIVITLVLTYRWYKNRKPREEFKGKPRAWQEKVDIEFDDSTKTDGKYLVFDIETTGLPKDRYAAPEDFGNWPRIVQIAWALFDEVGKLIENKAHILMQESRIPEDSIEIHGITDDMARTVGVAPKSAYTEFINAINRTTFMVAHNIEFDVPILECEFLRNGFGRQLGAKETICTMKKGKNFCRLRRQSGGYKYPTLEELFKKCYYPDASSFRLVREYHRANDDVAMTAKCFFKLKELNIIKV